MQDLQSIARERMFGPALERRLRPLSHHHQGALKCPRCDSMNTKFCYYNNYNLSQPRHFCKSCRRYWTKGGVLRNVPVGGGCRKNKRSKSKPSPPPASNNNISPAAAAAALAEAAQTAASSPPLQERKSSPYSSSESSSLTAAAASASATESVSGTAHPVASFPSDAAMLNFRDYESLVVPAADPANNPDHGTSFSALLGPGAETGAFTAVFGSFTGPVTAEAEAVPCGLELNSVLLGQHSHDTCQQPQWQNGEDQSRSIGGIFDQTVQVDFTAMGSGSCGGGFGPLDWQIKNQGEFDFTTTVNQAYWSQGQSQWTDRQDEGGHHSEPLPPVNFSQFLF
ncbi:dof zinc finger protein DOF5.4-like [Punica granatum]|uniref:Dof zinc finger protein n=2 Tax=Punica granatum TaxID=22663 RepID=A0A218Y0F4_PUNGR|nr:dof zinc finger protein DOF5.4-like [Punica granatum]OWM90346.1 hypothetical protein CDL15_Pgr014648 [Punica granatum]PKI70337.1 hypothetical protein CRG98_009217 [Punica granatum]